jgi:hypothetical protein
MSNLLEKASILLTPTGYDDGSMNCIKPNTSVGDFDFIRGSAATRVNSQGLVENVQILSGNLVQNGDFSQIGSELIPDGNFTNQAAVDYWQIADTGGVERATKSLENGFMRLTYDIANGSALFKGTLVQSGKSYKVTFRAKGTANSNFNSIGDNVNIPSNPQYVVPTLTNDWQNYEFYVPVSSTVFRIYLASAQIGDTLDITNISVKEVGQNWSFGTGWYIGENLVNVDTTIGTQNLRQTSVLTIGKKYKLTLNANITNGSIRFESGVGSNLVITPSDSNVEYIFVADLVNLEFRRNQEPTQGSITNISVIEITDDTDLPRIDYTNGTGSLLLEPQSTNTATYSNDFTQGDIFNGSLDPSLSFSVLTQNQGTAPDGTNTAQKLTDNNDGGTGPISLNYFSTTLSSGEASTVSMFVKKDTVRYFRIGIQNYDTDVIASFDLDTGLVNSGTGVMTNYGNGWYRCSVTITTTTDLVGAVSFSISDSPTVPGGNLRNGTKSTFLWGLQAEEQSYATSYIPTSGSTVTRNADVCNNAGSSDLINSTEGVLYAEIAALADELTYRYVTISSGSSQNSVAIRFSNTSNQILAFTRISGTFTPIILTTSYTTTNFNKIAYRYKSGDFALFINGTKINSSTSTQIYPPNTLNSLNFDDGSSFAPMSGKVKCVAVFKEALTDEELTCLTS